jgi:predicted Zn-dependent peptidase
MRKAIKTSALLLLLSLLSVYLIAGSPLEVRKLILKNGLTVYLNEDHSKPEIFGAVVVKTGSRNDPEDATGMAHYFEHIMFKGTDQIGTIDWNSEKIYLDSISMYYDRLVETTDENTRNNIHAEINRLSQKAAEFTIPNETDVLLRDIGGANLNAGTGFEQTVFYNSFPAYQLEKWMEIYAERFRNPVFRLFQSELEAVYEEKNLYSDMPGQLMMEDFLKTHYKTHPYSRPIIGLTEHLKNPQISKMMDFYNTWYVANNMALILTGSFNTDEIIPLIEEKFGAWRSGELPKLPDYQLAQFNGREIKKVRMSPIRIGVMSFRTVPVGHPDDPALEIATKLLSNEAGTGIFDQAVMDNKIMALEPMSLQAPDHGSYAIVFIPKVIGQSFGSAEKIVNDGLMALKTGNFSDELLQALKLEYSKEFQRNFESTENRAYLLIEAFTEGREWEDILNELNEVEAVTQEDITRVANTYLGDNRLLYLSKMGFPKKDKIKKPDWKPVVPQNADLKSEFAKRIDETPEKWTEPTFIEFGKDVRFEPMGEDFDFYYTPNPFNEIFTMSIQFRKGTLHDELIGSAAEYMNLIGTTEKTFKQFRSELQNIGANLWISAEQNTLTINIEGFDDKLEESLKLVNELLITPDKDDTQLEKFLQGVKGNNKMRRDDPMTIGNALYQYALYGDNSSHIRNLTYSEAKKLTGDQLISVFKEALTHDGLILYTGSLPYEKVKDAASVFTKRTQVPVKLDYVELTRKDFSENTVYLHHNGKARQSNINFYVQGNKLNEQERALTNVFNEYFGSGMSSLVFQEIREFRSLSYAAYATYRPAFLKNNPAYLLGYMNTQSDKTLEGMEAMTDLITNMPEKPDRMEGIRKAMLQSVFTSRPDFRNLGSTVARWRLQGYDSDPGEIRYSVYNRIDFNDIVKFYKDQIGDKPHLITVTGNLKKMDRKELEKLGKMVELKFDDFVRE